jgi:CubicO group peptidase (beta-lactamase class C family)
MKHPVLRSFYLFCLFLIVFIFISSGCKKTSDPPASIIYFPPKDSQSWESITPASLGWNNTGLTQLLTFLSENNTRAFIILKDGRIVIEEYWGNNLLNTAPFISSSIWYWASAGKALTAFLAGLAQQEGLLNINDKTSDYLGPGWTSLPAEKENIITLRHQLTMTTGLDYNVSDTDCTSPSCLLYKDDPGTRWFYHNAPYTLLENVISNAFGGTFNNYTDTRLENKTGMSGTWIRTGEYNNIYYSTARDAARFGLLVLNHGKWGDDPIMTDEGYFEAMVNTSQSLNLSYGYLWWLNGKYSIIYPGLTVPVNISLSPAAPDDMIAAMGKNGQFINVIPSIGIVVVRMGEAPGTNLVPVTFHNEMWQKIMQMIN